MTITSFGDDVRIVDQRLLDWTYCSALSSTSRTARPHRSSHRDLSTRYISNAVVRSSRSTITRGNTYGTVRVRHLRGAGTDPRIQSRHAADRVRSAGSVGGEQDRSIASPVGIVDLEGAVLVDDRKRVDGVELVAEPS